MAKQCKMLMCATPAMMQTARRRLRANRRSWCHSHERLVRAMARGEQTGSSSLRAGVETLHAASTRAHNSVVSVRFSVVAKQPPSACFSLLAHRVHTARIRTRGKRCAARQLRDGRAALHLLRHETVCQWRRRIGPWRDGARACSCPVHSGARGGAQRGAAEPGASCAHLLPWRLERSAAGVCHDGVPPVGTHCRR